MDEDKSGWKADVLVLSSGGVKGHAQIGAIQNLIDNTTVLSGVKTIAGTSVGAIIGLLYVLGYEPREILEVALETSLFPEFDTMENFRKIKATWGIMDRGKAYMDRLEEMVKRKCDGKIPTLQELYDKTGITYCAVATNVKKSKPAYFDHNSHPEIPATDAVAMSANIPLLFSKIRYNDTYYVDGAFQDPLPISRYDNGKTKILAIYVTEEETDSHGVISYAYRCASSPLGKIADISIEKASSACKIIRINTDEILPISKENQAKGLAIFNEGYFMTNPFIKELNNPSTVEVEEVISKNESIEILKRLSLVDKDILSDILIEYDTSFLKVFDGEVNASENRIYNNRGDAIKAEMKKEIITFIDKIDPDIVEFVFKTLMVFMKSQINVKERYSQIK